eukprot:1176138-Prorocentrum_minimum.AAC.3
MESCHFLRCGQVHPCRSTLFWRLLPVGSGDWTSTQTSRLQPTVSVGNTRTLTRFVGNVEYEYTGVGFSDSSAFPQRFTTKPSIRIAVVGVEILTLRPKTRRAMKFERSLFFFLSSSVSSDTRYLLREYRQVQVAVVGAWPQGF